MPKSSESPYRLVARDARPEGTRVSLGRVEVGGPEFVVAAGPCAIETRDQMLAAARGVAADRARMLRGGAYNPRTSPNSFQGLGEADLDILATTDQRIHLPTKLN